MRKHLALLIVLALPLAAIADTTQPAKAGAAKTAKPADAPKAEAEQTKSAPPPALLSSSAAPESALVSAAKRAKAARKAADPKEKIVIDDAYIAKNHTGGTYSEATARGPEAPPAGRSYTTGNQTNGEQVKAQERAAEQAKKDEASKKAAEEQKKSEYAADQTDEQYPEMDEDAMQQRVEQAPPSPTSSPASSTRPPV
jgi:hypothetical protein